VPDEWPLIRGLTARHLALKTSHAVTSRGDLLSAFVVTVAGTAIHYGASTVPCEPQHPVPATSPKGLRGSDGGKGARMVARKLCKKPGPVRGKRNDSRLILRSRCSDHRCSVPCCCGPAGRCSMATTSVAPCVPRAFCCGQCRSAHAQLKKIPALGVILTTLAVLRTVVGILPI